MDHQDVQSSLSFSSVDLEVLSFFDSIVVLCRDTTSDLAVQEGYDMLRCRIAALKIKVRQNLRD